MLVNAGKNLNGVHSELVSFEVLLDDWDWVLCRRTEGESFNQIKVAGGLGVDDVDVFLPLENKLFGVHLHFSIDCLLNLILSPEVVKSLPEFQFAESGLPGNNSKLPDPGK